MGQLKYTNGIYQCKYCGERSAQKAIHCPTCRTEPGRKAIFDANVAIANENEALGYTVPKGFLNWKITKHKTLAT